MKKMAYLLCASSLFSSTFLHAATLTRMNNTAHWGGWYTGINAGGWMDTHHHTPIYGSPGSMNVLNPGANARFSTAVTNVTKIDPRGVIAGVLVSYNYEHRYTYLFGAEADIQALTNEKNIGTASRTTSLNQASIVINTETSLEKINHIIGTVRARAGYMMTPKWLIYGTGGLGYGMANLKAEYAAIFIGNPELTRNIAFSKTGTINYLLGWSVGGGIEWMYKKNWIGRIEALYIDLGSIQKTQTLTQYSSATTPHSPYGQTLININVPFTQMVARAALSFRFA